MWSKAPFTGVSLPAKTLCLSFDDGPGPQTIDLAQYLGEEKIPAAFFFLGANLEHYSDAALHVRKLGHLAGSHGYRHRKLTNSAVNDRMVIAGILKTDILLADTGDAVFFRPPYGAWASRLSHVLNTFPASSIGHVGPIGWDIDGRDYSFWENGRSPQSCADRYLDLLLNRPDRRGIVLCHDHNADSPQAAKQNRSVEMMRILVPRLRDRGFAFVSLKEVPAIRQSVQGNQRFCLRANSGQSLSLLGGGFENTVTSEGSTLGGQALNIVPLVGQSVALRTLDGHFLAFDRSGESLFQTVTLEASGVFEFSCAGGSE